MFAQDKIISFNHRYDALMADGLETIIDAVKENGGLIRTPAMSDKTTLHAIYEDYFDGKRTAIPIHGLRYDDELGLCICTDDMLGNYQFDTGYQFENYFDFNERDLEELNKVLEDASYFVSIDDYDLVLEDTTISILRGLGNYL